MATGILGRSSPAATTNTTVYTVPASKVASFTISLCNANEIVANVRIALSTSATPASGDYIEYNASLSPSGILERSGLVANAGTQVIVYSSTTNVNVVVYGFEE